MYKKNNPPFSEFNENYYETAALFKAGEIHSSQHGKFEMKNTSPVF